MEHPNKGKAWLTEEVDRLKYEFNTEVSLMAMVKNHGRTASAIMSKLGNLGLVAAGATGYHRIEQDPWVTYVAIKQTYKDEV